MTQHCAPPLIGITFLGSSQWSIRSAQCCISFVREPISASSCERLDEISQVWLVWGKAVALPRCAFPTMSLATGPQRETRHLTTGLRVLISNPNCAVSLGASEFGLTLRRTPVHGAEKHSGFPMR